MGKSKLEKFDELKRLPNVHEYPYATLQEGIFPHKGDWGQAIFGNDHPIVLELGCGRGEYTVGLAQAFPEKNFIGIDIKGNRMWNGATQAHRDELANVAFLRTGIELIDHFFAEGEVSEIWLTFPDPQMKKVNKRLTSVLFLHRYKKIMKAGGTLHLKCDSPFMYNFTLENARHNGLEIVTAIDDIDAKCPEESVLRRIETYYESQWRARGITIKYLALKLDNLGPDATNTEIDLPLDSYRSYGRESRSALLSPPSGRSGSNNTNDKNV